MLNIAVFVSGGGTNLQNLIDTELVGKQIKLVVASSDKAYALERARINNIQTLTFKKNDDEKELIGILEEKNIELIVLAGYLNILSPFFLKNFKGTVINIHPSLLPSYGGIGMYGLKVHQAVLSDKNTKTGATVHIVTEEPDAGEILDQIEVPVENDDTPSSLQTRVMEIGEKILLPRVVRKILERSLQMKILVVGGGGREHALILKIKESKIETEIFAAPGNGGISKIAQCVNISPTEIDRMVAFAIDKDIELVIVTPDDPLVMGMVDLLEAKGIRAFGPRSVAAVLEGSKSFAKSFMKRHGIPTAKYLDFNSYGDAKSFIEKQTKYPLVIKADGLALGKGVVIAADKIEALEAIKNMMLDQCFGNSGSQIVIEEFLTGTELSVMAITDGKIIRTLTSAMDHKRAYDNDLGLNTGGMGAIAPHPLYTPTLANECNEKIFKPTIVGMLEEDRMFKGILYFGLMLTKDGPYVIEYNCRFGDPETQVVLPLLDGDLLELILAVCDGQLEKTEVKQKPGATACIIMASGGYPLAYDKGYKIEGLKESELLPDTQVYHAGTILDPITGNFLTAGGRVLGVTAYGNNLDEAIEKAYKGINQISFDKAYYRTDIGKKAGGN